MIRKYIVGELYTLTLTYSLFRERNILNCKLHCIVNVRLFLKQKHILSKNSFVSLLLLNAETDEDYIVYSECKSFHGPQIHGFLF